MGRFDEFLQAGMEINNLIENTVSSRVYLNEDRGKLFMLYLHTSLEYHRSILLLIGKNLHGSAFALQRVLYDSVLRGLWLGYCAADADIISYFDNDFEFLSAKTIAQAVDQKLEIDGHFQEIHTSGFYSAMCGYTHTGDFQISRRFRGRAITWNYETGEVFEVIHNSNSFVLTYMRFYIDYFKCAEDAAPFLSLYDRYMDKARKIFPELPP
jgi:hypothetical protein